MTASTTATASRAARTTLAEVRELATIDVFHPTRPSAAGLLGASRDTAYSMARSGELPTIRLGRRVVVVVPKLLAMLGDPAAASA